MFRVARRIPRRHLRLVAAGLYVRRRPRRCRPRSPSRNPTASSARTATLEVTAGAPGAQLDALTIALEQNGTTLPLFSLDDAASRDASPRSDADHLRISRPLGKAGVPELSGHRAHRRHRAHARRSSTCARSRARRRRTSRCGSSRRASRSLSTHHYVNHGGSEMVVYRATPADVTSGVRVGDVEYPGFPAAGAGVGGADPSL